jgi:hypothetical protein
VRLVAAPGALRGVELEVLGWRTEEDETALRCRLIDGSVGTIPARWTDLPPRVAPEPAVGGLGSPAAWRLLGEGVEGLRRGRPRGRAASAETEVAMSGQLALATSEQVLVAAAVWETLPPVRQREVTLRLAWLLARSMEAERDE